MLHEFFDSARNPEQQADRSQEEDQQALDALHSLAQFLQDPQSFYHPVINRLIAAVFPYRGNYPLDINIVNGNPEMMLVHSVLTPYIRDNAHIMVPLDFSEQVKNNPIE